MSQDNDDLTHLVYEAALDNSLWPELILELTEEVQRARQSRFLEDQNTGRLENLSRHFKRAFSISKRMVDLQEREAYLSSVLNSFSFGLALVDENGQILMANRSIQEELPQIGQLAQSRFLSDGSQSQTRPLSHWVDQCNRDGKSLQLGLDAAGSEMLLLPREEAEQIGFPTVASAVLISSGQKTSSGPAHLAKRHGLTPREDELLAHLLGEDDLRAIAARMGLSYESARTYSKRIYEKTGLHGRSELIRAVNATPLTYLRRSALRLGEAHKVRRFCPLADGRRLEYFILGPQDGHPVVLFDALSGVTVDVIGYPDLCAEVLERQGVRLIVPCRPGGFRSDPKPMSSLRDFAPDVAALLDHLGVAKAGFFSVSFGSAIAMATALEIPDRVERMVMSSAAYPIYRHENWRELDQFYHMSSILGRHWPGMLRQIIPFLVRSILQNTDRYFDRYCSRTRSQDDIAILSHPTIRRRTAELLAQRTALGVEGMVEENLLNVQGWDFDVSGIDLPVEIYQGRFDNVAPYQGAELLAQDLPQARITVFEDKGHYHHITNWPWLVARAAGRDVAVNSDRYCIPDF